VPDSYPGQVTAPLRTSYLSVTPPDAKSAAL
jgi:hypothetical protein